MLPIILWALDSISNKYCFHTFFKTFLHVYHINVDGFLITRYCFLEPQCKYTSWCERVWALPCYFHTVISCLYNIIFLFCCCERVRKSREITSGKQMYKLTFFCLNRSWSLKGDGRICEIIVRSLFLLLFLHFQSLLLVFLFVFFCQLKFVLCNMDWRPWIPWTVGHRGRTWAHWRWWQRKIKLWERYLNKIILYVIYICSYLVPGLIVFYKKEIAKYCQSNI